MFCCWPHHEQCSCPFKGSNDLSNASKLSANEVEELLKSATVHRQANYRNPHQNHPRWGKPGFYNNQQETEVEGADFQNHRGHHGNNMSKNIFTSRESYIGFEPQYGHKENQYRTQDERVNHSNDNNRYNHGNHKDVYNSLYHVKNCVLENWPASHHENSVDSSTANGGPLPRSQNQEVLSPRQSQLCYTPASYIPLSDYITVDEEELFCFSPDGSTATATYSGSAYSKQVPSPLYADDTSYTILNSVDTTEPITAIFMGFQLTQDDSEQMPECEASLKAELIIIDDSEDETKETSTQPGSNSCPAGSPAVGNVGVGDRWMDKQVATGIRKIKKKHKACCAVCWLLRLTPLSKLKHQRRQLKLPCNSMFPRILYLGTALSHSFYFKTTNTVVRYKWYFCSFAPWHSFNNYLKILWCRGAVCANVHKELDE